MKNHFKLFWLIWLGLAGLLPAAGCQRSLNKASATQSVTDLAAFPALVQEPYGTTQSGTPITRYTLKNNQGMSVKIINYGGIITSLFTPDKRGVPGDVVLGFDNFADYEQRNPLFGALVGRYANRIANSKFTVDGQEFTLAANNGLNHIHGGRKGFDKVVWLAQELPRQNALRLTYTSPDGEEGYPGTLTTEVTYTLTPQNELRIDYRAQTTKATPLNLTNHSYFNLSAGAISNVLAHEVIINADKYTLADKSLIPTGEIKPVAGTDLDFRQAHTIGSRISNLEGGGYDHNYVLNRQGDGLFLAARVLEPTSGRVMEVLTTKPGIQFYTGNHLSSRLVGKGGKPYEKYSGFCLETQYFPDSPNQPAFPSSVLRPGDSYNHTTIYRFSVQK